MSLGSAFFRLVAVSLIVACCGSAYARPQFSFFGPYQRATISGASVPLKVSALYEGSILQRNDYPLVGIDFRLPVDLFAYPDDGDRWNISIRKKDGQVLGQIAFFYDQASDCMFIQGSPGLCNLRGRITDLGTWVTYTFAAYFQGRCLLEEDYELIMTYQLLGEEERDSFKSPMLFMPTRFRPKLRESMVTVPVNLRPGTSHKDTVGDKGEIRLVIQDDLDCQQAVPDVQISIFDTVQPGSNGQTYFGEFEHGTGHFLSLGYEDNISEDGRVYDVEGVADENGIFKVEYEALRHGATENLKFSAKLLANNFEEEYVAEDLYKTIKLSHPGLVQISSAEAPVRVVIGDGCPHSPEPSYMLPGPKSRLYALAHLYHQTTERYLSLNDASLPWGGVIANSKGLGRDSDCHRLHRTGNDVDINMIDQTGIGAGVNIRTTMIEYDGQMKPILEVLETWTEQLGGRREAEYPIHFKW